MCAEKEIKKKSCPKLDLNSGPLLVSPVPYPVSYGEVLIGLHMLVWLLLTEPKIDRNSYQSFSFTVPYVYM